MTESAADEQDLAQALDNVANAVNDLNSSSDNVGSTNSDGSGIELPPIAPPVSPLNSASSDQSLFPPLMPPQDNTPQPEPTTQTDDNSDNIDTPVDESAVESVTEPAPDQVEEVPPVSLEEPAVTPEEPKVEDPPVVELPIAPTSPPAADTDDNTAVTNDDKDSETKNDEPVAADLNGSDEGPLADIKKDALEELRPLVDKLEVSPEEKFDTYLLLIRSTDDTTLIAPAHEAAKSIADESRRAEALLDIIKEIDYLSRQGKKS